LGIQAFRPVLIEGKAIQIHPLVCTAFNADFDGDQMAVHVPLSAPAQKEAKEIMLSTTNLLKPAAGEPVVKPSQDIVLGCYWITLDLDKNENPKAYSDKDEVYYAFNLGEITVHTKVKVRLNGELIETTVGRLLFNEIVPAEIGYVNETLTKNLLSALVEQIYRACGQDVTVRFVDDMKNLGFKYSTLSGISMSMDDLEIPGNKKDLLAEYEQREQNLMMQFNQGLITEEEKYLKVLEIWDDAREVVKKELGGQMNQLSAVGMMMNSGARGDLGQLTQMAGMIGNVVNAAGRIIELPIRSNYKEGLSSLEYFISTHGARKGLSPHVSEDKGHQFIPKWG
jgi:DNA-directed RNA polymerase subunit beta'